MPKPAKKGVKVDFSGVEAGGGSLPDGNYIGEVKAVELKTGEDSGKQYLSWQWKVKGTTVYDNTSLQPQALWRLRGLLEAMGVEVEEGEMDLDFDDLVGHTCGLEVVNEEYQGKKKPRVTGFYSPDQGDGETEEAPAKSSKSSPKFKVGQRVKFQDDDGTTQKGTIESIDGDSVSVDVKGESWEVELENLEAA